MDPYPNNQDAHSDNLSSVHTPDDVHLPTEIVLPSLQKFEGNGVSLTGEKRRGIIQELADQMHLSYDEFVGEMRKRGCSESTASKLWLGLYEQYENFTDNDIYLSNLRKAADVLKVRTGTLLPK